MSILDRLIIEFDGALRTLSGAARMARPDPADTVVDDAELAAGEVVDSVGLMRVNHAGEVCAQALYRGQALGTTNAGLRSSLAQAAREEEDHLAWTQARLDAMHGRTSLLNPFWYAGSFFVGYLAGRAGDAWNLGFLRETERQVEAHLAGHLDRMSHRDGKSRAVIRQMAEDEARHARTADGLGARELPAPVRGVMRASARVMTSTSYWI